MVPLRDNLALVAERIHRACIQAGRPTNSVRLIAVTKTVPESLVNAAFQLGIKDFGENRPQELARKAAALPNAQWHMIGHVQKNKTRDVAQFAAIVHSIDSLELLVALNRSAGERDKVLPSFVQVNVSREPQKHGVLPEELGKLLEAARDAQHIDIHGLMTVPLDTPFEAVLRSQFSQLRSLRDAFGTPSWELSMGMSHDFEIAIEEGATIVRIGSAIFGTRP